MKIVKQLLFLLLLIISNGLHAQEEGHGLVKWMSLNEALKKSEELPRPILIDFYTDWCGWCKTMVKTTYSDPGIADYINQFFYPVQFDAEGKDSINYLGTVYKPTGPGPRIPHPFAIKMLNDKLMYPTTLFLNGYEKEKNSYKLNLTAPGYLDSKKIQPLLVYTVEGAYKYCSPNDFQTDFEKAFYDSATIAHSKTVNWNKPSDAFSKSNMGKKTIVLVNTEWCNSCKVMKAGVFADSAVQAKVNKYYRLVELNAEEKDTIYYEGQPFIYPGPGQFHQLALAMTKNNLALPSLCIIDEKNMLIDVLGSFIPSTFLPDILEYYGGDYYKTQSWADYQKAKQ